MSVSQTKREERFPAARSRPTAYPTTLPFVADRDVEVIESRSGSPVLAARWLVTDPDALFSLLVSSSILDGWRVRAPASLPAFLAADCTLERNDVLRGITITRIDALAIVALTDASIRVEAKQPTER